MRQTESDSTSEFGSLLRAYRHKAQLTQRELAAKAGLSVATLRDFEQLRHRPRANSLAALADALSLTPDQVADLRRAVALPRRRPVPVPSQCLPPEDESFAWTAHSSPRGKGLWLAVLGPLEVWRDGKPLSLGPPTRRAVLGLLLVDPGRLVRQDTIVDMLWGDSPPRTAVGLVQAHVSRLRKLLSAHSRFAADDAANDGVIDSVRGAYRLTVSDQEVDLLLFHDLAARADAAWADGDDVTAVECYERAVSLWRGEPLADVDLLSGHPGITALRQELIGVLLRYAAVACALGQHHRVLPRLQALANAEPLNEPAWLIALLK